MPLVQIIKEKDGSVIGIWKMLEGIETLKQIFAQQSKQLPAGLIEKKQKEWLTSRIVMNELMKYMNENFKGLFNNEYGKPILLEHPFHVSLSHSNLYTVGIINKTLPVGIDIELIRKKVETVATKFLNDDEIKQHGTAMDKLCVCWGVKEVLYKVYETRQISLKHDMHVYSFDYQNGEGNCKAEINKPGRKQMFDLKYLALDNHILAYNYYIHDLK